MIVNNPTTGPAHDQTANQPQVTTMAITAKSTKAEILAAYNALQAQSEARYVTMPLILNTVRLVARELRALAVDVFNLGAFCRKGFDQLLDTYAQPVLVRK